MRPRAQQRRTVSLRLPKEMRAWLQQIADTRRESVSALIERLIVDDLNRRAHS